MFLRPYGMMSFMTEDQLIEKLRRIEALYAGAGSTGEREAAAEARERMLRRLREAEAAAPPPDYRFTLPDDWERRLFIALCRHYGLKPFRYKRQRYSTVIVKVSVQFVEETLWPEFEALSKTLVEHLEAVTNRVIAEVLHGDGRDVDERAELPAGGGG